MDVDDIYLSAIITVYKQRTKPMSQRHMERLTKYKKKEATVELAVISLDDRCQ